MDKDSTPDNAAIDTGGTGSDDDFDISAEDHSQDVVDDTSADSGDDTDNSGDNAPSDSDEDSADDNTNTTDETADKKTPTFDKDLDKWAEDRGYGPLETDKERRLAQDARNSQRDFSKRSEQAAQAKKLAETITETAEQDVVDDDVDPLAKDVAELKQSLVTERQNRQLAEFVYAQAENGKPVTPEQVDAMAELLAQTKETDGKAGVDFLLKNISRWHKLAVSELTPGDTVDVDSVTDKVRQEERARLAKQTNATGPNRSAKNNTPAKQASELEKIWADDDI